MVHGYALKPCHRLSNRRGAAFLLAVYFASLACLLLGGVSLQRTMLETRAAQRSRDKQQAFFLAEASLDHALHDLQSSITAIPDTSITNPPRTVPSSMGQATYTIVTTSLTGQRPVTRRVTATGAINGAQQQIQVNIAEPAAAPALQGLVTGSRMNLYGPPTALLPSQFMQIFGTVHAAGGQTDVMDVNRTKITGPVSVGAARPDPVDWMWPAYAPAPAPLYGPGIDMSLRPPSFEGPPTLASGFGVQMYPGAFTSDHFTIPPVAVTTPMVPDLSDPTYGVRTNDPIDQALQQNHANCTSAITLGGTDQRTIADGSALDIDSAPGKIAVCVTGEISLSGDSRLTFTSPATVYVVGGTYSQSGHATLQAVQGGNPLSNGVEIVLPRWAQSLPSQWGWDGRFELENWRPRTVYLLGGTFHGSIWAPYARLYISSNRDAGDVLEPVNTFAYLTIIHGASFHEAFHFGSSASTTGGAASTRPVIKSWSD